jgi:hypothetical protein
MPVHLYFSSAELLNGFDEIRYLLSWVSKLSVSTPYRVNDRMINKFGAFDGMRIPPIGNLNKKKLPNEINVGLFICSSDPTS